MSQFGGGFRGNLNKGYQNPRSSDYSRPQYNEAAYVGGDVHAKRKHSGAKTVVSKKKGHEGVQFILAWNYSKRRGLLTAFISEYKKTGVHRAENGTEYKNLLCKLHYKDSGITRLVGALLNMSNKKITIPELGMTVNVSAPNGGYFGTFQKK